MSFVFFAHAALLGFSCSSRTDVYAPGTQNLAPCLDKKYWLINKKKYFSNLEIKHLLKDSFTNVKFSL